MNLVPSVAQSEQNHVFQVSVLLYHGTQPERAQLLKQIRRVQGTLNMFPVVVTSFEISMIDRKYLQVTSSRTGLLN